MSNIQNGYVVNALSDEIDANKLRFYVKENEGLIIAARTPEGFITYLIDKAVKVLGYDSLTPDYLESLNETGADLSFVVADENDDVYIVAIDADGYERSETPFNFSDIWEVTYDDYEEFLDEYPDELFKEFDIEV